MELHCTELVNRALKNVQQKAGLNIAAEKEEKNKDFRFSLVFGGIKRFSCCV